MEDVVWDRGLLIRGDTLKGFTVTLRNSETLQAVVPTSVCSQIRDVFGNLVYSYSPVIGVDGRVQFESVPPSITKEFSKSLYVSDIEYTLEDGAVTTYASTMLKVKGDVSRCQI